MKDHLYRFSPIKNESSFRKSLEYITSQLEKLSKELLEQSLPITTLKVFSHYPEEYDYLLKLVMEMGPKAYFCSDTSYYAKVDEKIGGYDIKYIGVRVVDPYRLHVGCGDYEIENFEEFKKEKSDSSRFIRPFRSEMIELWHPDYDILGYVVTKEK